MFWQSDHEFVYICVGTERLCNLEKFNSYPGIDYNYARLRSKISIHIGPRELGGWNDV